MTIIRFFLRLCVGEKRMFKVVYSCYSFKSGCEADCSPTHCEELKYLSQFECVILIKVL